MKRATQWRRAPTGRARFARRRACTVSRAVSANGTLLPRPLLHKARGSTTRARAHLSLMHRRLLRREESAVREAERRAKQPLLRGSDHGGVGRQIGCDRPVREAQERLLLRERRHAPQRRVHIPRRRGAQARGREAAAEGREERLRDGSCRTWCDGGVATSAVGRRGARGVRLHVARCATRLSCPEVVRRAVGAETRTSAACLGRRRQALGANLGQWSRITAAAAAARRGGLGARRESRRRGLVAWGAARSDRRAARRGSPSEGAAWRSSRSEEAGALLCVWAGSLRELRSEPASSRGRATFKRVAEGEGGVSRAARQARLRVRASIARRAAKTGWWLAQVGQQTVHLKLAHRLGAASCANGRAQARAARRGRRGHVRKVRFQAERECDTRDAAALHLIG
jgi:hypothetical protein